jgi:hypothetical protein
MDKKSVEVQVTLITKKYFKIIGGRVAR